MLHVVKNTEDDFEDVIPPVRQECVTISLQYFKHHSEASVHTCFIHHKASIYNADNTYIAKYSTDCYNRLKSEVHQHRPLIAL